MKKQAFLDILDNRIEWITRTNNLLGWSDIWTTQIIVLEEIKEEMEALQDPEWETLEDIMEDIGKRMCHFRFIYPNAWYWTIQDQYDWQYKWETLIEVFKEFREELKRNWHYD